MQMRLGQYEEALESFQVAADLAPGIAGYRLREAQLLFQNAKSEEAVRMTRGVVRRNPYYAGAVPRRSSR
jgi:predicted Zn-dependent protease